MGFFRNKTVNLLNLHYGIHSIALNGGAAFFTIYLLQSGISIPGVLVSVALGLTALGVLGSYLLKHPCTGRTFDAYGVSTSFAVDRSAFAKRSQRSSASPAPSSPVGCWSPSGRA